MKILVDILNLTDTLNDLKAGNLCDLLKGPHSCYGYSCNKKALYHKLKQTETPSS